MRAAPRNALALEQAEALAFDRLCPRRKARALRARRLGFLDCVGRVDRPTWRWYLAWCASRGLPAVRVLRKGRLATVAVSMAPAGRRLAPGAAAWLRALLVDATVLPPVVERIVPRHGAVAAGRRGACARWIPAARAAGVARRAAAIAAGGTVDVG
jgi:hypothetical protein